MTAYVVRNLDDISVAVKQAAVGTLGCLRSFQSCYYILGPGINPLWRLVFSETSETPSSKLDDTL
jgi:hypothetical protein